MLMLQLCPASFATEYNNLLLPLSRSFSMVNLSQMVTPQVNLLHLDSLVSVYLATVQYRNCIGDSFVVSLAVLPILLQKNNNRNTCDPFSPPINSVDTFTPGDSKQVPAFSLTSKHICSHPSAINCSIIDNCYVLN